MSLSTKYVQLDRQFADLGDVKEAEDLALRSHIGRAMGVPDDIGWKDIYRDGQSCVILGEAGSGKSREMEEQARMLRAAGIPATHVDLRDLLAGPSLIDGDSILRAWRRGPAIAWFFLDSVDEAKLTHVSDFHLALKRMAAWVGADSARARYVISSRISEWRPGTDKRLVEETLLLGQTTQNSGTAQRSGVSRQPSMLAEDPALIENTAEHVAASPPELRVLALLPLTEQMARAFLAGRGSADERFFAAVEYAGAWDFLHRPLDVTSLYALWQNRGRLGTLSEVVEHSVTELLLDPRRATPMAAEKLREGAEQVAACMTFGKVVSAFLSDAVLPDATDALRFRSCLPQTWADAEVALLAQTPIFDAAAYGKTRFHHRSYQAYLAASWLARLMRADCPYAELRHLLFGQGPADQLTLRPSLDSAAAWLTCLDVGSAPWQAMLRIDLLQSAPWVFFAHGDPRSLPVEYKARVLRRTVDHFKGRDHVRLDWDRPTLKRFADPGLTQEVARMIADASVGSDLRADYMMLARYGGLLDALHSVVAVAIDASANEYLRATALICISEVGSLANRREVLAAFESCDQISVRLGVQLVQVAYPQAADERELFVWLRRIRVSQGKSRSSSLYALDHFIEKGVASEQVLPLVEQLCSFLQDDEGKPRQDNAWAGEWLSPLAARLLHAPRPDTHALRVVVEACALIEKLRERHWLESWRGGDDLKTLSEATTRHPALRREWYWRKVAQYRAAEGKEPHATWALDEHYAPLSRHPCDWDWLVEDLRAARPLADRQFALRSALAMSTTKAGQRPLFPPLALMLSAIGTAELRRELVRYVWITLSIPWHGLRRRWDWNWRRSHWWRRRFQPMREHYWNARNRVHLWWRRADLAQGRWWHGSWFIIERARTERSTGQWGSHDLAAPMARYGKTVVEAAMAGADRIWRQDRPDLPHEKPERNQTSARTILGLVALQHAWETQGAPYFSSLTREDAEVAARFALDELNGLPAWFAELASSHRQPVMDVIALALEGEWQSTPADGQFSSPTLQRLVHGPEPVASLAAPVLRTLLQRSPPANTFVLRDALRLALREGPNAKAWLAVRAAEQIGVITSIGGSDWPWLVCLFLTDADSALNLVGQLFTTLDASRRDDIAVSLCAHLLDDFRGGLSCSDPDFQRPAFLRRFIPWVHQYVRLADDAVHEGSYSPDARDNAERFRGSLLGRLDARVDDEADAVLAELASDPQLTDIRDFVLQRIDQRRSARADEYTVEPRDLESLLARHERVPRNRADLFHLAISRLGKFKEEVESAEISRRRDCGAHWQESDYQDWLQRWLKTEAHDLYTIPSEAKVDPGKFPDLRFEAPGVDGAVSVEAKVATFDHWSYAKLEERLRNQLFGQYLRARNARFGIYVLFRASRDRRWRDDDGVDLEWPALLTRLQAVANDAVAERADVDHVVVLGIDVTTPVLPSDRSRVVEHPQ
jgi:hypothetical protein